MPLELNRTYKIVSQLSFNPNSITVSKKSTSYTKKFYLLPIFYTLTNSINSQASFKILTLIRTILLF